jgi:hypothetical protein
MVPETFAADLCASNCLIVLPQIYVLYFSVNAMPLFDLSIISSMEKNTVLEA